MILQGTIYSFNRHISEVMRMKKVITFFLLALFMAASNILVADACWSQPVPFEIYSETGERVFVFTPTEDSAGNAHAAVYEIIDNKRHLIYAVENLTSFAYISNFYFTTDMMNFIRTFPQSGMSTFEVYSNGIKTGEVMRSDFIDKYNDIEGETSIGPIYAVTWSVDENALLNDKIIINTSEGKTVAFDFQDAKFISESTVDNQFNIWILLAASVIIVLIGIGIIYLLRRKTAQ